MRNGNFILKEGAVRLSDDVRIREEYFGGIVFHRSTGDTLEVDHEAYKLLAWLRKTGAADIRALLHQKQVRAILPVLLTMNIIEHLPMITGASVCLAIPDHVMRKKDITFAPRDSAHINLSTPETVHLAVTYRCDETCPDCYVRRQKPPADQELNTVEMCNIIDILADNGVFQLAVGGGEPFVRTDISDIIRHAAGRGLVVHLSTGQYVLKPQWEDTLKHVKSLHIGIRSEELINDAEHTSEKLRVLAEYAANAGIGIGANIIMTRFSIRNMDKLVELLLKCGYKRLIFLRYKPTADRGRWNNENPDAEELKLFKNWLTHTKHQYPQLMLRVDCASAFLMKDTNPLTALRAGIRGCAAGEQIISVAPDGSVYPCSQLVGHVHSAGNLTSDSFMTIWQESHVLNKYRHFRQSPSFVDSVCGQCDANSFCGGCRVFAKDILGSEPFCPMAPRVPY